MRLQIRKLEEYTKVVVLQNLDCKETASKTTKVHNLGNTRKIRLLQALHGQGDALFGGVHAQDFNAHDVAHLQNLARVLDELVADL